MMQWALDIYPHRRSLSGPGVRETLQYLKKLLPNLNIHNAKSGEKVFDWIVPDEWNLREAYIEDENGKIIVDINNHGLHVVGYSEPINTYIDLGELQNHLHSLPEQPDAIPYVTSYYERRWGFCISQHQRDLLKPGRYHVVIDADLKPGYLNYADLIIPGQSSEEIVLSTYICHPMMANNEISGPVVTTALARWISKHKRRFTYRIIFLPETIGAIIYINKHLQHLRENTHAGFVITCVGDERTYSFVPSRLGNTITDRAAKHILKHYAPNYKIYSFLDRGSDERQYCSPLVDLPFVSLMRSKYGTYPEYHTSKDDFSLVSAEGLEGGFEIIKKTIKALESNYIYHASNPCEPQLGRRGLYPSLSIKNTNTNLRTMMNLLAYSDGNHDLLQIADIIGADIFECINIAEKLYAKGVIIRS